MTARVQDVMTPDPMTVGLQATVVDAYALMEVHGFRHVPVVENDELIGIVSLTDIGRLGATIASILDMKIGDVMTKDPLTVRPDELVNVAAARMAAKKIHCLPVVTDKKLVGIVTTYDLLDALVRQIRTDG
jgi:acetoin utilization protein AcuB